MDDTVREDSSSSGGEPSAAAAARSATESVAEIPGAGLTGRRRGSPAKREDTKQDNARIAPAQRIVLLDVWERSDLTAVDFAVMVGVTPHTLYEWKRRFQKYGPAGLMERRRGGRTGSRLPEPTQRSILLMKWPAP